MAADELKAIAQSIVADNKGVLAADESTGTIKKRFDSIGVDGAGLIMNLVVLTAALSSLNAGLYATGRTLRLAIQQDIAVICMHTNADCAEGGVNEVLAGIFGMRDWEVFADGCGRVGEVEPITVPELACKAQAVLGGRCNRPRSGPAVQVKFADTGKTVKRLAVISGAGGSMFEDALAVGADCLLTGEANHHAAIDAVRLGLSLVAAGHYATEFPVCAAIADRLRAAFPELEVRVSGENRDPFTYI